MEGRLEGRGLVLSFLSMEGIIALSHLRKWRSLWEGLLKDGRGCYVQTEEYRFVISQIDMYRRNIG